MILFFLMATGTWIKPSLKNIPCEMYQMILNTDSCMCFFSEPKRTRRFLSAIINFWRFSVEREDVYYNICQEIVSLYTWEIWMYMYGFIGKNIIQLRLLGRALFSLGLKWGELGGSKEFGSLNVCTFNSEKNTIGTNIKKIIKYNS